MTNHHLFPILMTGNNLLFYFILFYIMKKIISTALILLFSFMYLWTSCFATTPKKSWTNPIVWDQATIVDGVDLIDTNRNTNNDLIIVIKNWINRILGVLSLIALIILLWGWFQMVTAAWDEKKYEAGFTILKQAAFGLMMIWVAWFVVSIIFYVINFVTS